MKHVAFGGCTKFELNQKEQWNYIEWVRGHDAKCGSRHAYHGAIHIGDAFKFTNTSVGTAVEVECVCGEKKNITDYDSW